MTSLVHDFRYATRQLLRTPGFTAAAVITLALGIGVNTAFFAIVNAVVFRPMRSLALERVYTPRVVTATGHFSGSLPLPHFRMLERNLPDGVEAVDAQTFSFREAVVHIPGRAERVQMIGVSGGHAEVFRLQPQAGRFPSAEEDRAGARTVTISDRLWREWFNADPAVVEGQIVRVNNDVFQIVGVAPAGYRGATGFGLANTDLWAPMSAMTEVPTYRGHQFVGTFVKLAPGVSQAAAAQRIVAAIREADPEVPERYRAGRAILSLQGANDGNPFRMAGFALLLFSALVLLAACANLANMLYVRGAHRRAEMAVRQALGASTSRIFRLLLCEALVIGAVASALGLALATASTRYFSDAFPMFRDRAARVTIDLSPDYFVFAYAFAAGVAAALFVGVGSAWRASRVPPLRGMAAGDAATSVTRTTRRTRLGMVGLQVCAAVILLMGTGLFYQQTGDVFRNRPLFDTAPLATARIELARHGYTPARAEAFYRRLVDDLSTLEGVDEAAVADGLPSGMYLGASSVTFAAERSDRPFSRYLQPFHRQANGTAVGASPRFLRTLGLAVVEGRDLSEADTESADSVLVVSRSLAAAFWPDGGAIGKRLMFGNEGLWRTIVGVCDDPAGPPPADAKVNTFPPSRLAVAPFRQRYPLVTPASVSAFESRTSRVLPPRPRVPEILVVLRAPDARGRLDPLRTSVAAIDPNVAVFDAATVDESILAMEAPLRAARLLMGSLGVAALAIAILGVHGVVAFLVARRTREFGIRLALGAERRHILRIVMDEAVHLLLVGLAAGVFIVAVGERFLQTGMLGLMPNDIATWAVVLFLILTVGLAAALVPARRAAGINPNVALRDL